MKLACCPYIWLETVKALATIGLLGCDEVHFDGWVPNFRTNLLQQVPSEANTCLPNYTASHLDLHTHTHTHIYIYMYIYTHTHIYIYIYIYIYTHNKEWSKEVLMRKLNKNFLINAGPLFAKYSYVFFNYIWFFIFNATFFPWHFDRSPRHGLPLRGFVITLNRAPLEEWSARSTDLVQHTTLTRNKRPCLRQDTNPQSQQSSSRKPTPWTTRSPGSAI